MWRCTCNLSSAEARVLRDARVLCSPAQAEQRACIAGRRKERNGQALRVNMWKQEIRLMRAAFCLEKAAR